MKGEIDMKENLIRALEEEKRKNQKSEVLTKQKTYLLEKYQHHVYLDYVEWRRWAPK
jgi:hypothetical protein